MSARTEAEWEAMAQAAELMADEAGFLYGVPGHFDYETVETIKDWGHEWAAKFREHSDAGSWFGGAAS